MAGQVPLEAAWSGVRAKATASPLDLRLKSQTAPLPELHGPLVVGVEVAVSRDHARAMLSNFVKSRVKAKARGLPVSVVFEESLVLIKPLKRLALLIDPDVAVEVPAFKQEALRPGVVALLR